MPATSFAEIMKKMAAELEGFGGGEKLDVDIVRGKSYVKVRGAGACMGSVSFTVSKNCGRAAV